jgi:hypothetical protein
LLCRPKIAPHVRDAVSSAGRSERVRARRECSRRVKRRRGPPCGKSSRTRELPNNTRRRGERSSRRPRSVAASVSTARAVRVLGIDEVEPPGSSRRARAADTGGPRRCDVLPDGVAAGMHRPPRAAVPRRSEPIAGPTSTTLHPQELRRRFAKPRTRASPVGGPGGSRSLDPSPRSLTQDCRGKPGRRGAPRTRRARRP